MPCNTVRWNCKSYRMHIPVLASQGSTIFISGAKTSGDGLEIYLLLLVGFR